MEKQEGDASGVRKAGQALRHFRILRKVTKEDPESVFSLIFGLPKLA